MRGGKSRTYPAFEEIEADLGYNPARFLDALADAQDSIGDTSKLAMAEAMIRGLDESDTIRAWIEVEVALGRDDGGPRQCVIKWLNQRQAQIKDTDTHASEPAPEPADTLEPTPETDETAEPASEQPTATTTTTSTDTAVVTDGGEAVGDPICSACGEALREDEILGERCYWCPNERDFRQPTEQATEDPAPTATAANPTDEEEEEAATTATATEPPETPRCSDCHAALVREEVGDETAFWCAPCGGHRELLTEDTVEAVA